MTTSFMRRSALVAALLLAAQDVGAQQGSLAAARQLYAGAEYQGALTMLDSLLGEDEPTAEDRPSVELYRVLCLMAVGNTAEALKAIDTMVTRDPLSRPVGDDIPPRVRTALTESRRRVLPQLIQQQYVLAKAAFDRKDFAAATEGFGQVMKGLSDPDIANVAAQSPLADIRVLATGFNDLTAKALIPPAPAPAPAPPPVPELASMPAAVVPPLPSPEAVRRLYGAADANVVPPQAIRQQIPAFPGRVVTAASGFVEVIVGPNGVVEEATIDLSLHNPEYVRMALSAAKSWTYRPATLNGAPVRYRKRIQIKIAPSRLGS